MNTKTFTLSGTFPEQSIVDFAKNEGRREELYDEEQNLVKNEQDALTFVSQFFLDYVTSKLASLQKMKVQEEFKRQIMEANSQIDEAIKSNLSITIE